MSEYSNPKIREGINVSDEHPLTDFLQLVFVVTSLLAAALLTLILLADFLVKYIPFGWEASLAERVKLVVPEKQLITDRDRQIQIYLEGLVERLRDDAGVPPEWQLRVQYVDDATVNAAASLDGQVIIYRGLLEKMQSENGLAFVMAHELAHLKERHPVRSLGRGVVILLSLTAVAGISETALPNWLFNTGGQAVLMSFSRGMEEDSDRIALQALQKQYGSGAGAQEFFDWVIVQDKFTPPSLLSTHPAPDERIETMLEALGCSRAGQDELVALPTFVQSLRRDEAQH